MTEQYGPGGANWYGQLGDGTTTKSTKPIQIKDLNDAKAIAAGRDHNLALKNDGTVWAWGDNGYGQLGDGTTTDSNLPIQVKELNDVKAIAVGQSYSLAIKNDGTVWAWGHNYYEQLGDGTKDDRVTPVMSKDITAPTKPSDILTIIEENNVVLKWQPSIDGDKVAYYEIYRDDVLVGTVNDTEYKDIDAQINKKNIYMVIAVDASGNKSEPGFNDIIQPSKPLNLVAAPKTPTTVSLEWEASTDNDEIEGYEIYRNGVKVGYSKETNYTDTALPHNSTYTYTVRAYDRSYNLSEESNTVTVTTESLTDVSLAAGENYSLQVKSDGTVWAWGYNARGQLGDETTIDKTASRQVKDLKDIVAVAAGESHSLALRSDGTVWVWGSNSSGQLGDGTTNSSNIPKKLENLRDIKAIAAGESNSLVIKNDGTVWTWGRYWEKQNGIGTSKSRTEPVQIEGLFDVKAVAAGSFHSLALKNDGTVWTWGYNSSGFGDEATKSSNIPIQVKDLGDIKAIAAGGSHSLAIKNDETVWSWGDNQKGQLGDGTRDSRDIPVLSKDVTSPTNPADLTAAIEENHVVLKWQPSIDGDEVAGYEIYRDDVMIDTVNETTFIDADIEVDKAYIYTK